MYYISNKNYLYEILTQNGIQLQKKNDETKIEINNMTQLSSLVIEYSGFATFGETKLKENNNTISTFL